MQAQCDACHRKGASVFCNEEELALCGPCGSQRHQDNTLARDHHRVSFFYPVPKQLPICDICQETKAFIFCREHRGILCRTCDMSMHLSDKFTKKHNRLLLTGTKLCINGDTSVNADRGSPAIGEKHGAANQLEVESGGSTSSSVNVEQLMPEMPHTGVDITNDDPYGLCKQRGEGSGSAFDDTNLGRYLNSLWPKKL